jgi:hypothetical protein
VSYLKSNEIYDESFNSINDYFDDYNDEDNGWCADFITNQIQDIEMETQNRLQEITGLRAYTICVMKYLKESKSFTKNVILLDVIDYARISWSFWNIFDRNFRYKMLKSELDDEENDAVSYCKRTEENIDSSYSDENVDSISEDQYDWEDGESGSGSDDFVEINRKSSTLHQKPDFFFDENDDDDDDDRYD